MSTMTFAFHPFHDPHNLPSTHSLPSNPPSITAPTSLHDPAFPANYDAWGLAPTTFSPAQYGPPAGFHHGDETHGLPLDMHLPDASSLLFGSYAPPPEISQLSPSTILRHDTYESVLGNAFNPVAPTGLAPQAQAPISLPTLDFPCLAPPPSLPAQTNLPASSNSALSDPTQSISPPERPACLKRVSKRKRERSVSREEDPDPYITSQSQPQADPNLHSYTTPATPKSPNTSRVMIPFLGRGGSSGRMQPPPVPPLPVPPLQAGHHQRSTPTSSGLQQQPLPGYPTGSVGPMDERSPKRRRVDDGQSPSGLSVAQQQQQLDRYPTQQYQSQNQAHWYGSGAPPTNAPVSQPSQPAYGYSSTSAGSSYSNHAHSAHASTRPPPMYAAPIPTAPSQWTGSGSTQGHEQYYYTGPPYSQPMQAYQQSPYTSPTHATGTYQVRTPAGSASSGSGSIARPTPPMASGTIPSSATVPLVTSRPLSSSAGSKGGGSSATVPAAGSQVPPRSGSGGNPMSSGATAPVMMDSVIDVSGDDRFEHGPSEFPPKPYPGGEKAKSPWWPTRKTEKLYGSRLDQVRFLSYPPCRFYHKLSSKRVSIEPSSLGRVFPRRGPIQSY